MYKVTSAYGHQDRIKVEWNLGKRCNLDCDYCPSSIHDNFSPHTDIEILKSAVDKLANTGKNIRISLTGGEPSVHPKISELAEYIKSKDISWLSMTTNGLRPASWYDQQQDFFDQFVFSLHYGKFHEDIFQNILEFFSVRNGNTRILVHVMAHHKHMPLVMSDVNQMKFFNIPYVIRRIRWTEGNHDLFDDMRYEPNDLLWIKDMIATAHPNCLVNDDIPMHANDIIKMNWNKFKGWSCNAGLESLMINWDGTVYRATCRVGDKLGNIYNDDFVFPQDPVICTRNFCTCEADIPLTKLAP